MKSKVFIIFLFALSLFYPQIIKAQKKQPVKKTTNVLTSRQIAEKVLPSVVLIIAQDENENPISQGSGFVIGQGLVVSNLHVFERATNAIVKNVKTGETSKAIEVVAMNAREDICVIRIGNTRFPILSLGNSDSNKTGDEIYVASNPKGLEGSFTKGIISSLRNDFGLFQIDAAISSGSSGGVLLNQKAEAIGIIKSSLIGGQNLNFAIPINKLKKLPYKFNHSIQLAGACAFKDRDKESLKGLVKSVRKKELPGVLNSDKKIGTELITTSLITYDIYGNKIEDTIYDATNGNFAVKFSYTYDENNLPISMVTSYSSGKVDEASFEQEGSIRFKLAVRNFSLTSGNLSDHLGMRIFDSSGNLVSWLYSNGTKIVFNYDENGWEKERIQWRNGKIEIITNPTYKSDRNGNWIEQQDLIRYPNTPNINPNTTYRGNPEYREITYYEQ